MINETQFGLKIFVILLISYFTLIKTERLTKDQFFGRKNLLIKSKCNFYFLESSATNVSVFRVLPKSQQEYELLRNLYDNSTKLNVNFFKNIISQVKELKF